MLIPVVLAWTIALAEQPGTSICGKVRDPTNYTVPGAAVRLESLLDPANARSTYTGGAGDFCFNDLEESLYSVEVSVRGFLTVKYYPIQITFPSHKNIDVKLLLTNLPGVGGVSFEATVSGTLRVAGQLLTGVSICLISEGNRTVRACTKTNDLGQYALLVLPGKYSLEIRDYTNKLLYDGRVSIDVPGFFRDYVVPRKVSTQPDKP